MKVKQLNACPLIEVRAVFTIEALLILITCDRLRGRVDELAARSRLADYVGRPSITSRCICVLLLQIN